MYPSAGSFGPTWYFVQAGAVDKRAQQLPLPDDLSGELIRFQVAHQIGHALGFPHNFKASSTYTLAQVRDPKWVKENGFVASIMDDARFNYVAQPEDGIDPADLIPKIGPYDKFAVTWGYKPIPTAKTPDQEDTTLDQWAREQDAKPYLRFSTEGAATSDPVTPIPKPWATWTRWPPRAGPEEPHRRLGVHVQGHDDEGRRPV